LESVRELIFMQIFPFRVIFLPPPLVRCFRRYCCGRNRETRRNYSISSWKFEYSFRPTLCQSTTPTPSVPKAEN